MDIKDLLLSTKRIALVGASDRPDRASHGVMKFLLDRGYDVTPVNPTLEGKEIHGRKVVGGLAEAGPLDLVDVFRRSEDAGGVMDEAVALGARAVWLQLGVVNEPAAERARAKGIEVVMDHCPVIEWSRLGLPARIG
jgi:predicted CoA-binding protein